MIVNYKFTRKLITEYSGMIKGMYRTVKEDVHESHPLMVPITVIKYVVASIFAFIGMIIMATLTVLIDTAILIKKVVVCQSKPALA